MIKVTKLVAKPYKKNRVARKESKDYKQFKRILPSGGFKGGLSNKIIAEHKELNRRKYESKRV